MVRIIQFWIIVWIAAITPISLACPDRFTFQTLMSMIGRFWNSESQGATTTVKPEDLITLYQAGNLMDQPQRLFMEAIKSSWQNHPSLLPLKFITGLDSDGITNLILHSPDLQIFLNAITKGLTQKAKTHFTAFSKSELGLFLSQTARQHIANLLCHAAKDPEVIRLNVHLSSYVSQDIENKLEDYFLWDLVNSETQVPLQRLGDTKVPLFTFRPHQIHMARYVLQHGLWTGSQSVLEIGYAPNPSILKSLRRVVGGSVVGVDVTDVPNATEVELAGIHLYQGNAPHDTTLASQISNHGPYTAIFALDVFRARRGTFGIPFDPKISYQNYLTWIKDQLEDGGLFIVMNDNRAPNIFSEQLVKETGFTLVRWAAPRSLSPGELKLYAPHTQNNSSIGNMLLYVMRKGDEPSEDRMKFHQQRIPR